MPKNKQTGFATRAIHVGQEPDPSTGAVTVPIHATSTYVQQELGKHKGYEYSRVSNPTRDRLEKNLAALDGGIGSRVFASGIPAISEVCHRKKIELVVDNTFMSPYFQQPIALGADMVVHSTTKFLNGHSDGLGGVVACTRAEQVEKLAFVQKAAGAVLSPFECWLVLRGVKTLGVRMRQHDQNGRVIAEFLHQHKKVKKVFYPGLLDHPQHELAK